MANDGYDPLGSCFLFDYDPVAAGLNVVSYIDAPLAKHTIFTDEDKKWLNDMSK
jgi:hypothetical protein